MASADRLIEVFNEAKARSVGTERDQYLAEMGRTEPALKEEVLALLQAHAGAGDFLQHTQLLPPAPALKEHPGDRIGRYKLLEQIGEGGCGVVYMAEQESPVRRRVALKVIKLGMDTKQVIARFEAERQALAMMDHANIAKVLEAGATETGRPFFVMELVRGIKITDFCDQNKLATKERLELFTQVCQAIQHAHQKGVIHRDIKPSNILVTLHDDVAVPKVIDFGIAKATVGQLTDKTVFTAFAQFIGTPAYMSPEQAQMSGLDVDTRADIYSLGVLLYELLTGNTPFDAKELQVAGVDEMRRKIREDEPLKPSTCLSTMQAMALTTVAKRRHVEPPKLIHLIRGDLDWIVMKALEKDRTRRYETANGLAMDIQRHLSDEPVIARPPSGMYRLQKLAQRNRGALFAAATVLVALLVAVITLATSNARIRQERNQKDEALRERGTALEAARNSEQAAREQLFVSLQNQAQARRNSRQMGQRVESLAALTEAARIRATPELRDSAIAALAIPDVQLGYTWGGWDADTLGFAYDSLRERYARLGQDGAISIRLIEGDREIRRMPPNPVTAAGAKHGDLTFSPDGRLLAWLDDQGRLGVWRWESGESILNRPPGNCWALAFSPDGRRLAVGHESGISCFDLIAGELKSRWPTPDRPFRMSFHPDSRQLAVGFQRGSTVAIYSTDDGKIMQNLSAGETYQTVVAWHPDGELLATGGWDSRIQIWNVKTQRKVAVLEGHVGDVTFLNFHPRGDLLASLGLDGIFRLWQPSPGRPLMRVPTSGWLAFSGAGPWAGVSTPSRDQAQLWRIVPSEEYHTFLNPFAVGESGPREGDISPDGSLLALGATDGVRLWDVVRGHEVAWLPIRDTFSVMFRANGRELLTCGPFDGLQRWRFEEDPESEGGLRLGPPHQIAVPFAPMRIAMSGDERTVAVAGESTGQNVLLDLETESLREAAMPHGQVSFIAMSANTERLVSSGWHSETVKLWEGATGKLLKEWQTGKQSRAYLTPDGRELILSRAQDFTFYDLTTLRESRRIPRDLGLYPGYVAFTADRKLMAMEMSPGTIHLKEFSSGRTVAKLEDPLGDHSTWMNFTPDGTQLIVAASYAGAIHRWDLRAIRERLKPMNLDWEWPEFPPAPSSTSLSKHQRRLQIQLVGTNTTERASSGVD